VQAQRDAPGGGIVLMDILPRSEECGVDRAIHSKKQELPSFSSINWDHQNIIEDR
jgi:hypothetical protein